MSSYMPYPLGIANGNPIFTLPNRPQLCYWKQTFDNTTHKYYIRELLEFQLNIQSIHTVKIMTRHPRVLTDTHAYTRQYLNLFISVLIYFPYQKREQRQLNMQYSKYYNVIKLF